MRMKTMQQLLSTFPRQGKIEWIGIRPARRETITIVNEVRVSPENGLEGDRYQGQSGTRQITLIQAEHLPVIASLAGREKITPEILRRNVVVSGINLLALRNKVVQIGNISIEVTGLCHPCSRMEEVLGEGGYNAVRSHGGITARILKLGSIRVGDSVWFDAEENDALTSSQFQPDLFKTS